MGLRVIVTGAADFIGQAVCAECATCGHDVVTVQMSEYPFDDNADDNASAPVSGTSHRTDWRDALTGVDAVVHLAERTQTPQESGDDASITLRRANVLATTELAKLAAQAGVKRFVFLSSIKVNGELTPHGQVFTPDDEPAPQDVYGQSKLDAELALRNICARTGMEFVTIRAPLVYGPGVQGRFQALMHMVRRGIPLPLGAIDNRRSLVALDNLVDLIATCLVHPAAANQVFMAGDGEHVSTSELLRKMAAAYGLPARLVRVPAGLLRLCAMAAGKQAAADFLLASLKIDTFKTRDVLGWVPVTSMDEQLKKMT